MFAPGLHATAEAASDVGSSTALAALWAELGLPREALDAIELVGSGPVLPSSFAVATAAQVSIAAAALAAAEVWQLRRGIRQRVTVERTAATLECSAWFSLDGRAVEPWEPLSGLYRCGGAPAPGWVRIHANFAHHRDSALALLGLPPGPGTGRDAVSAALASCDAFEFEARAAAAGAVVAAARTFAQWDAHPQAAAIAADPLVTIDRIGDAPARPFVHTSGSSPAAGASERPLAGVRVLDLTRILAGPVAGRTLAAHGADVLLVNSPKLPNIAAIADTSRGKRSAHLDLEDAAGRATLGALALDADVFVQGYRPGALAARGFGAEALAARAPGLVVASLSAYGTSGPWAGRRGFDSLVQTATGLNVAEAAAFDSPTPKALPIQILDLAAGHLLAAGIAAALWHQRTQGGSWHVRLTLGGVARWLRALGRVPDGPQTSAPALTPFLDAYATGFGLLRAPRHSAVFSVTPPRWDRPSMPPGTHAPCWGGAED